MKQTFHQTMDHYTIYINEKPLILTDKEGSQQYTNSRTTPVLRYVGSHRFFHHCIENLEKNTSYEHIVVFHPDFQKLMQGFYKIITVKEAAGGVVFNEDREVLLIYTYDHWDMPKGHMEAGETREVTAVREVQEETGLQTIALGEYLTTTRHIFRNNDRKRVMKVSHWFKMKAAKSEPLTPQAEENIQRAEWFSMEEALQLTPIYKNIRLLLDMTRGEVEK